MVYKYERDFLEKQYTLSDTSVRQGCTENSIITPSPPHIYSLDLSVFLACQMLNGNSPLNPNILFTPLVEDTD